MFQANVPRGLRTVNRRLCAHDYRVPEYIKIEGRNGIKYAHPLNEGMFAVAQVRWIMIIDVSGGQRIILFVVSDAHRRHRSNVFVKKRVVLLDGHKCLNETNVRQRCSIDLQKISPTPLVGNLKVFRSYCLFPCYMAHLYWLYGKVNVCV